MYKIVSTISGLLRVFIFPNPFTKFFELYFSNTIYSGLAIAFSDIFNLIGGGIILYLICYSLVGIVYESRSCPAFGSILYGIFVLVNSKVLIWVSDGLNEADIKSFIIRFFIVLLLEVIILITVKCGLGAFRYKYI